MHVSADEPLAEIQEALPEPVAGTITVITAVHAPSVFVACYTARPLRPPALPRR